MGKANDILRIEKNVMLSILSGAYTPLDLREFARLCHDLALPLVRKKLALGKINLSVLGMSQGDIVYDCIADLFRRESDGNFPEIRSFFHKHAPDAAASTAEELTGVLRWLIFGKVNNNIVRLYNEADPVLGKILRNLKLALEKSPDFRREYRFSDLYLLPSGVDPLMHLEPMPFDELQQRFTQVALTHDPIPRMLAKLGEIMADQETYQRAIPFVFAGLMFKSVYVLGWDANEETPVIDDGIDASFHRKIVDNICRRLRQELHRTYVEKGKCSDEVFGNYIEATRSVLTSTFLDQHLDGSTYFEYLQAQIPGLTKEEYHHRHRQVLEYLTKIGRERLKIELRNENR